tara:strand:- start:1571 stop:1810 length:240 start_codon:yes stop_codon:yes gene_type:complete
MKNYLNTLIAEKNLDLNTTIEVEGGEWGTNFIPLEVIVDFISQLDSPTQKQIKNTLVKIDFNNGDIMHFFKYIAEGIAI